MSQKLTELRLPVDEVKQAAANSAHRRNVELARSYRLPKRLVEQPHRALDRRGCVIDAQRHGADRSSVRDVEGMGKALGLAINDDVDLALSPAG